LENLSKDAQTTLIKNIQEEMKKDDGPDFSKLPIKMNELQMKREDQDFVLIELKNFLMKGL
jgi:hypothetical protein